MSFFKPMEHQIKAAVFGLCRIFLNKGQTDRRALDPSRISRVLFLRPEKIGDMVISLPVFDALKKNYPHIRISVLASPRSYALVKDDPRFERVFLYRKRLIRDIRELLAIRRERFECVFDMIDDDSVTTLFYSQLASSDAIRIGLGKSQHARFYDFNHVHADGIGSHIVDNTLKLLKPFGLNGSAEVGMSAPHITAGAMNRVEQFVDRAVPKTGVMVGFNLSAGKPNRIWPESNAIAFCRELLTWRDDIHIIVIVAPNDRRRGLDLLAALNERATLVPDGLGLIDVSALISQLKLLVSPDTSLIHIARSCDVPVVGLYSRATKNFQRWKPYRQPDGAVLGNHIDNISDITVAQVVERVKTVLKRVEAEA